jgi:ankyrin repeat protein
MVEDLLPMTLERAVIEEFIDAAVQDAPKAIRLLQEFPELRDARWLHQETVLHFLAIEGYTEALRLLGRLGFDANVPNEFGDPPLIDVATLGNNEVAEVLLGIGADPNARSEIRDNALHCAVRSGNARLVHLLLSAGAKADYVTSLGETVFDALPQEPMQRAAVESVLRQHGVERAS